MITYHICKKESESENCLVIKLLLAEQISGSFTFFPEKSTSFLKHANDKDREILKQFPLLGDSLKIPYAKTHNALKLLVMTNYLFFDNRQIVCDFFGKTTLSYHLRQEASVFFIEPRLQTGFQEFPLSDCLFICGGNPPFFIKGISLKFITSSLSWKQLWLSYDSPQKLSIPDLQEDAAIDPEAPQVHLNNLSHLETDALTPWPLLVLQDRLGSFANLWMIYAKTPAQDNALRIPFSSQSPQKNKEDIKRKFEAENAWEKDLLETDFIRKTVGSSHYYCPLDKITKTLSFLLELGWMVIDHNGNNVVKHTDSHIALETHSEHFLLKGSIDYGAHQTSIQNVAGAFNRREHFVQLSPGNVGLIPENLEQFELKGAVEEGEIVGDGITIRRSRLGGVRELLETKHSFTFDAGFAPYKELLLNFSGFTTAQPSCTFQGVLRPYQQEGVNWLNFLFEYQFHGMLADDMGLGKTVQVIAFLSRLTKTQPHLIVVPTSLIFNWRKEVEKFLPSLNTLVHHGSNRIKSAEVMNNASCIITTYATLRLDIALFKQLTYSCLILDEAQIIKNSDSLTAQSVKQLQARFRLSITGTPIENHLKELWSHFDFLMPDLLGDEKTFSAQLEASIGDSRYLKQIRKKIRPFLLRRTKIEVAKDLPERIEQEVWVEMPPTQRKVYEDFLSGVRGNLLKKVDAEGASPHRMEMLEAILRLRQICCHPLLVSGTLDTDVEYESAKLDALLQDIETAIKEGRKCLIYSQFTSMLTLISKECRKRSWTFVYLDGNTKNREEIVRQFQEDDNIPLFLISLKAGGIGLNLTAADYVFLFDPWWNTAIENQAIDRAHRIGRRDSVIAKRYIIAESIEEKIVKLKAAKNTIASEILDDAMVPATFTAEDLRFLLT